MIWPRVIGLLATQDRPALAHRAAHLFFEQDYGGLKTLLVFDDGVDQFQPCSTLQNCVTVVRHARVPLPVKRNRMVQHANDPDAIYFVWDDDDYHGPTRVRRQVEALLAKPEVDACLLRPFFYYNEVTNEIRRCIGRTTDATVAFRRAFWDSRHWDETIDPGSGYRMIVNRPASKTVYIDSELDYVVVWHGKHRFSSPPNTRDQHWTDASVDVESIAAKLQLRTWC